MKKIVTTILFTGFLASQLFSQCAESTESKVLLVGDSWAFFMSVDGTINTAFNNYGHSNYKFLTNATVAENGAETDDFLTPAKQDEIVRLLNENPSIEVVHLSIGGNDVLGDWNVSFTQAETDTLKRQVADRLLQVITFIKSAKPGIKIVYSGYCYPNFEEVVTTSAPPFNGSNHPFYSNWANMGFPTALQLNNILNDFGDLMQAYSLADPDVKFYNANALMQYTHGQPTPLGVAPGGTYPAFTQPMPEGDPNYPSPKESMRNYLGLTKDCFHLSAKGYLDLIEYNTQKFYQKFLMDDKYYLSENNSHTGSVSTQGAVSSSLILGNSNSDFYSTVLSFNTTTMKDTTLQKASIFLRRESSTGQNLVNGNLQVKVKSGNFGTTVDVEATDYADGGDASGNPCIFGANTNGYWVRLDLPSNILPYITKADTTQFIISAENISGSSVTFSDASNPEYAPILNLAYGMLTGISETEAEKNIQIFPNPTNGLLRIESNNLKIQQIQITDMIGKTMMTSENVKTLDISGLSEGLYLVSLHTSEGIFSKRIVKE